jgi:V8-like Glu-specific endopeptidase
VAGEGTTSWQGGLHAVVAALGLLSAAVPATASSDAPLEQTTLSVSVDSGLVLNQAADRRAIFKAVVRAPDAPWVRLRFDVAELGAAPEGGGPTVLRLTALADGAVQHLDAEGLAQWRMTSAYFNGDAVGLELIAAPGAGPSRVALSAVLAGVPPARGTTVSICGPTDDRVLSSDDRTARLLPGGCTAFLFSDEAGCLLTAGHCIVSVAETVEFNVPLSDHSAQIQHPGPEDQYAVDLDSIQFAYGSDSNDWAYFGCFPNTETGLTPQAAQGAIYILEQRPPEVQGQTIRITGYGLDDTPPDWSQVQQTHAGPYVGSAEYSVRYEVDTQAGNSGSAVVNLNTGQVIGIHTSNGCDETGGSNLGTGVDNPAFRTALLNPDGVCVPATPLRFEFPEGLPPELDLELSERRRVEVYGQNGGVPAPGTGMLHYEIGTWSVSMPLYEVSANVYDVIFPVFECGEMIRYWFTAETMAGEVVQDPFFAPTLHYEAIGATNYLVTFNDDFEADHGWTVENLPELTDGGWETGVPVDNNMGDPPADGDGSGRCFLTGNAVGDSDVEGASTILTSPILDASEGTPIIAYYRWFSNSHGPNPFEDSLVVEVSADGGQSWAPLETVGPGGSEVNGEWFRVEFAVADFVPLTNQFRIRFIASDTGEDSIVEAGIDGVRLTNIGCTEGPASDLDGDGFVNVTDFLILLAEWGPCSAPCPPYCLGDIDTDCTVGVNDFLTMLGEWTP